VSLQASCRPEVEQAHPTDGRSLVPRQIEFAGSAEQCALLLELLTLRADITRLSFQPGASLNPRGDIVTVEASNRASRKIVNLMSELDLLRAGAVTISEPNATIPPGSAPSLHEEGNDAVWEEVGAMMRQDTSLSFNFLILMALAGGITTFGIVSDTLHVVVGAMLIAPGFEPILRVVFGVMGDRHSVRASLASMTLGYLALCAAAAAVLPLALMFAGIEGDDLGSLEWAVYWSSIEPGGVFTSLLAGTAGGVIVASRMKILATGVMVALALVPSAALVGMGLAVGDATIALGAAARWMVEAGCVTAGGGAIILLKRTLLHHRRPAGRRPATPT